MVDVIDDYEQISIVVQGDGGGYENFDVYTHGGEPDGTLPYLQPSGPSISIVGMPRSATSYLQAYKPIGNGDFSIEFSICATELQPHPDIGGVGGNLCLMFTNNQTTTNQNISSTADDGLLFTIREWTGDDAMQNYLFQIRSRQSDEWKEYGGQLNVIYDITISRVSGLITYTISTEGTVVFTRTILDATVINYFVPMCGRGGGGAPTLEASGILENCILQI